MKEAARRIFHDNTSNMAGVRACVYFLVFLVNVQAIAAKPFFGMLWCDLFCEEDYDERTTTTLEDLIEAVMDPCSDCPTSRPITVRPPIRQPFNFVIPPSINGMNLTMTNTNGAWQMNVLPWPAGSGPAPGAAATPAPAPAATTPAGTTAAGTTAASTTAKK